MGHMIPLNGITEKQIKIFTWSDPTVGSLKQSPRGIPVIGLRIGLRLCGNSCLINGG